MANDLLRRGILETAQAIGANPLDLATAISYETGGTFDPTKRGPTTQWGQHRGLIQFGEPQARQFGVDWNDPLGSQLGADGAIAKYFQASGFKPGMSGLDLYSTINAGAPGKYSASDANNGGAPGSVQDKWGSQMDAHRQKAAALLDGVMANATKPASGTSMASFYGAPGTTTSMAGKDPLSGVGATPQGFGSLALLFAQQQAAQQQRRADEQAAEETRRAALFAPDSLATLFG